MKPEKGGSVEKYRKRFDLLLNQLAKDIGHEDWCFVMNTVSKKKAAGASKGINDVLADIAKTNPREFFTTPRKAHKEQVAAHSYNHILVGENNARLFIESFLAVKVKPEKK